MRDRVKRGILSLAVVVGCFALLPPLAAEPAEAQKSKIFKRLDANNDGVITQEEVRAAFRKRFKKFDANSDGVVTLDEVERMADERFKRFDLNGDGQATKEEIAEARRLRDKE
jgi:Ca2+-binding EF-hand superfamily protein